MPDIVGQTLQGRYHIVELLGRGATAEVYVATDTRRQVGVAIKVLREDLAEDPEFVVRFRREADALARLDHPYIVRFYSFEQDGTTAFIVMDYVPGTSLRERMLAAGGSLPLPEVSRVLRQVGSALHYAHALGYVHRDIKPANVMLREDGTALLSDFGIARAAEGATITAGPLGTPAYISPEQIAGRNVGPWTDIYSLGIVLYEMVTGQRPFVGRTGSGGTAAARVRDEQLRAQAADPRTLNHGLPPAAVAVIARAMAKDPAARWPDASALVDAWDRALSGDTAAGEPVSVPAAPPPQAATAAPRPGSMVWAIGGVAVLLVGTLAAGLAMALKPGHDAATATPRPATAVVVAASRTPVPTNTPKSTATRPVAVAATVAATATASATPLPAAPTATPTRDVQAELYDALVRYADVRAQAEETLNSDLLAQVCVDPYLSWKVARIEENKAAGSRWETVSASFSITSLDVQGDRAEVWVSKTETKLYYAPGAAQPDDVACGANIYSYRDCTYDAQYVLLYQDGRWYVSEANAPGSDCQTVCQQ